MARSYATVGQMLTYAVERSSLSLELQGPARVEVILRHMLEFVLMSPRSRDAFLRTVARTEHTTGSIAASPRLRRTSPDLVAELLPSSSDSDDGARLGIALRVGGPFGTTQLREMRAALGSSPRHLLLAIARHTDRAELEGEVPDGVVATSWARVGGLNMDLPDEDLFKRMVKRFIDERTSTAEAKEVLHEAEEHAAEKKEN